MRALPPSSRSLHAAPYRARHATRTRRGPGFFTILGLTLVFSLAVSLLRFGVFRGAGPGDAAAAVGRAAAHGASSAASFIHPAPPPSIPRDRQYAAVRRLAAAGKPVYCGGGTKPLVALTFDDGPGPLSRKTIVTLRRAGAHATFFLVGKELAAWPRLGDIPRRERHMGALGDHSWSHLSLVGMSDPALSHEVADTRDAIQEAAHARVMLFRPPYGARDSVVDDFVRSQGMLEVLWSLESNDTRGATRDDVYDNVVGALRPGAIVLMHENRRPTALALPRILETIRAKGLRAVSVPEMMALDPPTPEQREAGIAGCYRET